MPRFDRVLLTRYENNPRGVAVEDLDRIAEELAGRPRELHSTPVAAWRRALELAGQDDLICVTGSFFLAAELRSLIRSEFGLKN